MMSSTNSGSPTWREHGNPLAPATGDGPLRGLRVAVKDLFQVAGHACGAGNPRWLAEQVPADRDAAAVAALRSAGAAIAGIAHTDELAFSLSGINVHYGTPPNPAAPDRVPGGSSSGPAAAVAAAEAEIGLGTDTAGSIRVPASCTGLFGLRPTHAVVPVDGLVGLAPSFDTVGWLARDATTLRAVGEVLLPAESDRDRPPATLVLVAQLLGQVAEEVAVAVRVGAARAATAWGCRLVEAAPAWADELAQVLPAFRAVQAAQAWRLHGDWISTHPATLSPEIEARFRYGAGIGPDEEQHAQAALRSWCEQLVAGLDDSWLALPAAAGPAHLRSATGQALDSWRAGTLRATVPASAAGLPSASLPALAPQARTGAGAGTPVGLAIIAGAGADLRLLDALMRL